MVGDSKRIAALARRVVSRDSVLRAHEDAIGEACKRVNARVGEPLEVPVAADAAILRADPEAILELHAKCPRVGCTVDHRPTTGGTHVQNTMAEEGSGIDGAVGSGRDVDEPTRWQADRSVEGTEAITIEVDGATIFGREPDVTADGVHILQRSGSPPGSSTR